MDTPSERLVLALLQQTIVAGDRVENLRVYGDMLAALPEEVDVAVMPEMFATGFMLQGGMPMESHMGATAEWLLEWAERLGAMVCGTVAIEESGKVYNRFYFAKPDGRMDWYDKMHIFSFAGEDRVFSAGAQGARIEYKGWSICPQVCYDLRFPEGARNLDGYDVLLYSANFPEVRDFAWRSLLVARAIENQCYVGGCNRVGVDGKGAAHCGSSLVLSPSGEMVAELSQGKAGVVLAECSREELEGFRRRYPFLRDI